VLTAAGRHRLDSFAPHELEPGDLRERAIGISLGVVQHRRQHGLGVVELADDRVRLADPRHRLVRHPERLSLGDRLLGVVAEQLVEELVKRCSVLAGCAG
jgi:hypothetical protein